MSRYFTQDWFYRAFHNPGCVIKCFLDGMTVSAEADSSPDIKKFLNIGADCLRIRMETDAACFSCDAALFNEAGENLHIFDNVESGAALSAFAQFIRERYGMGLVSYWHRNLNRDTPGYRPLKSRETTLVDEMMLNRAYSAWAFRSSREALEMLDSLAMKISGDLDKPGKYDPDALDWFNCIVEMKRKILIYGLPSVSEANMFYGMEISRLGMAVNLYHIQISYDSPIWIIPARNKSPEVTLHKFHSTVFLSEMPYLSCAEYARRSGVSQEAVLQWIQRGEIRAAVRHGDEWKLPADFPLPDGAFTEQTYVLTGEKIPEKAVTDYPLFSRLSPGQSFQICVYKNDTYAVFPLPREKSTNIKTSLAIFSREERERFEFYLLCAEWVEYKVPKYLLPLENRAQPIEK